MTRPRILAADIIDRLAARDPASAKQLLDVLDYIGDVAGAGNPSGMLAEGSLADLVMRQPPAVRSALYAIKDAVQTERDMPFQPKLSESDWIHRLGGDVQAGVNALAALDGLEVMGRLQSNMGDDSDRKPEPPTTRDHVAHAVAQHEPFARRQQQTTDYLSNASEGRTLRNTIEVVGDLKAQHLGQDYSPVDNEPREPGSLRDVLGTVVGDYDAADSGTS